MIEPLPSADDLRKEIFKDDRILNRFIRIYDHFERWAYGNDLYRYEVWQVDVWKMSGEHRSRRWYQGNSKRKAKRKAAKAVDHLRYKPSTALPSILDEWEIPPEVVGEEEI